MATPSPPTNVSITKVSNTKVRVTWSGIRGTIQLLRRATPGSGTAAWEEYGLWIGPVNSGHELTIPAGYEYRARVRSVDLWDPGNMSGSVWSSDLARCFDKPSTPASVALSRTSDKSWPIAITHAAVDATKPVAETVVESWLDSAGDWVVARTLSGRAESMSYAYDIPDNRLRVRVATRNAAGTSGWVYSSTLSSTPAKATGVTGARSGATGIVVKGTILARYATTIDVLAASSPDGITWTAAAVVSGHTGITTPGAGQVLQRTITTLDPNLRWRFTYRTNVSGGLSALSDPSAAVLVLQPPAAPTQTGPDRVQDAYKRIDLTWRHEPVDGSAQTAAEVRWRVDGGAWTTVSVTTATKVELHYPTLGEPGTLEWDVRTKGAHNDFGARSGIASVAVRTAPESPITSPADGAVLSGNRLTLSVGWADAQGAAMVAWTRRLYRGAELIEERSGTGTVTTSLFATPLKNETTYRAEWVATSGTGLSAAVASVEVTTAFTPPFVPEAFGVVWVEDEALARVAAAAGGLSTAWAGTAGSSVSIESRDGIETRRNLATNPKLTDTYGTLAIPDIRTNRATNPRADATWVPNYGTGGAGVTSLVGGMRRMEWTTAPTGGNPRVRAGGSIPVTPGETITISADMASSRRARIALDFNLAGAWVSSVSAPWTAVSTDPASPTRLTYTRVVPAGVDAAIVFLGAEYTLSPPNLPAVGDWYAAGRQKVETGAVATDYLDGDLVAPDPGQVYGWAGTPGASPSWLRWVSAAGGSGPRPRRQGGADAAVGHPGDVYAWVDGDAVRVWCPTGSTNAGISIPATTGDASGTAMARHAFTKGKSYAAGVLYSQDVDGLGGTGVGADSRHLRVYRRTAAGALTPVMSTIPPDIAQADTLLTVAWTIAADDTDCSLVLQSSGPAGTSVRWRRLIICEGLTEADAEAKVRSWFDGDSLGARTSSVASRIERSDDDGQTWTTVVDAPSPVASADDVRAPLNRVAWYRVVTVSALGVEATTDPVQVATPCGDVWLEGEDGRRARIRTNLRLAKGWAQEAVAPVYYGQAYGESHYGDGRTDDVTVTGTLIAGEGLEQDLASLLRGQDVYYRDPRGAAWWAQLAGRLTDDSDWIERTEISVPLTRVLGGGDDES